MTITRSGAGRAGTPGVALLVTVLSVTVGCGSATTPAPAALRGTGGSAEAIGPWVVTSTYGGDAEILGRVKDCVAD